MVGAIYMFAEQTPMRKMAFFGVKQIGVMITKFKEPSVGDVAFVHIDSPNSCTAIWAISNFHQTLSGLTNLSLWG